MANGQSAKVAVGPLLIIVYQCRQTVVRIHTGKLMATNFKLFSPGGRKKDTEIETYRVLSTNQGNMVLPSHILSQPEVIF